MSWKGKVIIVLAAVVAETVSTPVWAQEGLKFVAPQDQIVAIRAGHLFDARTGRMLDNQVVLIQGDRIADVGAEVQIPATARVLDMSSMTVLPGMIDTHVHLNSGGNTPTQRALIAMANAQTDLDAGFTTVLDMDSRGGFNTVDLRDAINSGLLQGPRMQVVGQSINQRATNYYPDSHPDPQYGRYYEGFTETKNVNSPWLARAAVRENKLHGVDYIKIYTTQDFVGPVHMWKRDATLINSPSLTLEEVEAIVDEAHRLGLKVACHTYGGEGMNSCLTAGVDAPNDLIALEKADLRDTGGRNSRLKLLEQAVRRAVAAGVPIVFGSGATSREIPHGKQANQFNYYAKWGMGPVRALQTAYLPAAQMLNYGWESDIGTVEKGKFADIIAVAGNPTADVAEMERVKFVMKGGTVVRNDVGK